MTRTIEEILEDIKDQNMTDLTPEQEVELKLGIKWIDDLHEAYPDSPDQALAFMMKFSASQAAAYCVPGREQLMCVSLQHLFEIDMKQSCRDAADVNRQVSEALAEDEQPKTE